MAGESLTLVSRTGVVATDGGADVNGTAVSGIIGKSFIATYTVGVSGGTLSAADVRAVVEGSVDGGTTWFQLARMPDMTTTGGATSNARGAGIAAASVGSAFAASALGSASAGGAVSLDGPLPPMVRGVTRVVTRTVGSGSPAFAITLRLYVGS
jgi:hypothetical protein